MIKWHISTMLWKKSAFWWDKWKDIQNYLVYAKGDYETVLTEIADAFTACPYKVNGDTPVIYDENGNAIDYTLTAGDATIDVAYYKTLGLFVKFEDLGSFANGAMVEAFNDAVKAIWDKDIADEVYSRVTILEDAIETEFGYHLYINLGSAALATYESNLITPDAEGKLSAAAAVSGTWNAKTIKSLLGDNMGVIKLPTVEISGQETQLSGFMGYKLIGVNGYSQNKAEAHKLALWLTNEQNQLKRFEVRGFGPTNKVVAAMEVVQNDPVISVVLEQAQFNRAQKGVPGNYWTPMGSLITPIITAKDEGKTVSDEELLELLVATCNSIRK